MRKLILLFLLGICAEGMFSQKPMNYSWPIDSTLTITGNYGELRPNHFHAGIDFSTAGKLNLPVVSIEEGYVSRIRVSAFGYGKCIYITHPNGKVSVYAHLNAFSLKIANVVKKYQYDVQSFEVDFYPKLQTIYVRKNEIIARSGNTGGSTGPHLHFELRDEQSEMPLNPLTYYSVNDNTPPYIEHIAFYDLSDTTAPKFMFSQRIKNTGDTLILDEDHVILNNSIIGLSYSGFDKCTAKGNPNNIFSARIYCDDSLIYYHQLRCIAFTESRYINEFCEKVGNDKFQKCFLPTIYPDEFYDYNLNKGRLMLSENRFRKIKFVVNDEAGNQQTLVFYLKTKNKTSHQSNSIKSNVMVNCNEDFSISKNNIQIHIPARTLYYSTPLILENTLETSGKLVILPVVNLRQPAQVGFKVPQKYVRNRQKLLLRGASNNYIAVNRNDSVFFFIKEFDWFYLTLDTIPPKIKVAQKKQELKNAWKMDSFSFHISDNLIGIAKYNLWLNNSWVLAEFDNKTDLLTYYFDEDTPMGILNFKLEVIDKLGNRAFLDYELRK
jgi:hypothetical protein